MINSRRSAAGDFKAPGGTLGAGLEGAEARRESWDEAQPGSGAPGSSRKKRRRQRSQRGKRRHSPEMRVTHIDTFSRERIFQDVEGLLRQIREQAEETSDWPEERLNDIVQTVTGFTKSLEEQNDTIPERIRAEYQRIREKLTHALRANERPR